ncbi:MAG: hypothetical protein K8T26_12605 [Lentisphaerae bacterium]|nr:hypothetical protein [Lentisphaerota bacterium]
MKNGKDGVVLIIVMSFLTVLLVLASTIHVLITLNARQTAYATAAADAFHEADAGADYVFGRLRADEFSGVVTMNTANVAVDYPPPAGYHFDTVTNVTRLTNKRMYLFRVIGHSGESRALIDVALSYDPAFLIGAFGNDSLSLGPTTRIYSYNSSTTTSPTTSTGEGSAGSNESMGGAQNAVDGSVYLGEDESGNPATYSHEFTSPAEVVRTTRIDPDPLGAASGQLSNEFVYVSVSNDNATAVGGTISGGQLRIDSDTTLRAGSYYVSDIDLGSHEILTIDATGGPVKIYLTGDVSTQPSSSVTVNPPVPNNFQVYAQGASTIQFQPNNTFIGFLYAPYGSITIQPNGDFYGALWGNTLSIAPNGNFYVDMDFVTQFDMDQPVEFVSWKQVLY